MKASNLAGSQESNNSVYSKRIPLNIELQISYFSGSGFVQQTLSLLHIQMTSIKLNGSVSRMVPSTDENM